MKAVAADTTQPIVDQVTQHHAPQQQPAATETPQEQAYIALLQQQQEEQMRHIRELEARLQRQQQMNQQLQQGHPPQTGGQEQSSESTFQLPTEVFAQIQALTGMVNQPGNNPPGSYATEQYSGGGENYEGNNHPGGYEGGNPPDYRQQYDQEQEVYPPESYGEQPMADPNYQQPLYGEGQHDNSYMASQQVNFKIGCHCLSLVCKFVMITIKLHELQLLVKMTFFNLCQSLKPYTKGRISNVSLLSLKCVCFNWQNLSTSI